MRAVSRGGMIMEAIDVALEPVKLLIVALGLLVAILVSGAIYVLGQYIDSLTPDFSPTATALKFGAIVLFFFVATLLAGTICRMSYADLSESVESDWRTSLRYARAHWAANFVSPILLAITALLVAVIEVIIFGFGRLPFLGNLIVAIAFLPAVLLNTLIVLLLVFGIVMVFPAVAIDGFGVATAPARVITLIRRHIGSVVGMLLLAVILAVVTTIVILGLVSGVIVVTTQFSLFGAGGNAEDTLGPEIVSLRGGPSGIIGGFVLAFSDSPSIQVLVGRLVVSVSMLVLFAAIFAFPVTFLLTTACTLYLALEPRSNTSPTTIQEPPVGTPAGHGGSDSTPAKPTPDTSGSTGDSAAEPGPSKTAPPGEWLAG